MNTLALRLEHVTSHALALPRLGAQLTQWGLVRVTARDVDVAW